MEKNETERIRNELSSYLRVKLRTGERTEDIIQEAFSRLYSSARFSQEKVHFGYLLSICRNIVRDEFVKGPDTLSLNHELSVSGSHLEKDGGKL